MHFARKIKTFGNSMYPLLHNGDIIYLQKKHFSSIQIDNIVCFKKNAQFITHRVMYRTQNFLITKGDNAERIDGKVYAKDIIGIVKEVERDGYTFSIDIFYLQQSSLYFNEITKINAQLQKASLSYVFLKGLPLHLYYQHQHPKRYYADCDILVKRADKEKIDALFKRFGYKKDITAISDMHERIRDKVIEVSYIKYLQGFFIVFDVHFEPVMHIVQIGTLNFLYPQQLVDSFTTSLLSDKRIIRLGADSYPILRPDDLLIYLAFNFFHQTYKGIHRLILLHAVLSHPSTRTVLHNLDTCIAKVVKLRLQNYVFLSLSLLHKYFPDQNSKRFMTALKKQIQPQTLHYINKQLDTIDIFAHESRLDSGIKRFLLHFHLSSNPLYKRLFVFLNIRVIYSILWTVWKKGKWMATRNLTG